MLRLTNLSNKYYKRLVRPAYAHTQMYPYACVLSNETNDGANGIRQNDGSIRVPANTDTTPLQTRTAAAYTLKNSLIPGLVMVRTAADRVHVATGVDASSDEAQELPFGLLANFVGGDLDDIGDENSVGVWRGVGGTVELLAPAFNDTTISAAYPATKGARLLLYADTDGRLTYLDDTDASGRIAVARLIDRPAATRIVVELLV